jgi:hypothetical protein
VRREDRERQPEEKNSTTRYYGNRQTQIDGRTHHFDVMERPSIVSKDEK